MSLYGGVWENSDWQGPDVRLSQQTLQDDTDGNVLPSAVPVFIGWGDKGTALPLYIASSEQLRVCSKDWSVCLTDVLKHYFDNGGGPCWVYLDTLTKPASGQNFLSAWDTLLTRAWTVLSGNAALTLVAVPQLVNTLERIDGLAQDGLVTTLIAAWKALMTRFLVRKDLFFVLDTPSKPAAATACIKALRSDDALGVLGQHAAMYGPHLLTDYRASETPDAGAEDGFRVVPPCGAVLGNCARTDAVSGVWKAPANDALAHVVRPQYRETLAREWFSQEKVSINLIRSFPGRGTRLWGCRTLAHPGESRFDYVQIRRLITWIEANLKEICRFAVFEPNNEITWFQLRGLCQAWLRRLWLEGGLAGADEASAYTIRVGLNESMSEEDIDAGRLVVNVAVAVLQAAEFIDVTLVLKVGHVQANDAQ